MKIRTQKATPADVAQYEVDHRAHTGRPPVAPLSHWMFIDGVRCGVEGLFEGDGNPNYELRAPHGMHFGDGGYDTVHGILGLTLTDLRERAQYADAPTPCRCTDA